jgi:hypothetical protein
MRSFRREKWEGEGGGDAPLQALEEDINFRRRRLYGASVLQAGSKLACGAKLIEVHKAKELGETAIYPGLI